MKRLSTINDIVATRLSADTTAVVHGVGVAESCMVTADTAELGLKAIALIHRITLLGLGECRMECDEILDEAGVVDDRPELLDTEIHELASLISYHIREDGDSSRVDEGEIAVQIKEFIRKYRESLK